MSSYRTILLFLISLILCGSVCATEYDVGGGDEDYSTLSAAVADLNVVGGAYWAAGDIINIYPGTYTDYSAMNNAAGTEANPITIRGVDSGGDPITSPQATVVFDATTWTSSSYRLEPSASCSWIVFQGLCFEDKPDDGGGGVIQTRATGTTVIRYCLVDNCYTSYGAGGSGSVDTLIIEYCEFKDNVIEHTMYSLNAEELIVQYCYFHGLAASKSIIKSRDLGLQVLYNYIDVHYGTTVIDFCENANTPSAANQDLLVIGNVIVKSTDQDSYSQEFIKFCHDDRTSDKNGDLVVLNNTFIDDSGTVNGAIMYQVDASYTTEVSNNIFHGFDDIEHSMSDSVDGRDNWLTTGTSYDELTNSTTGSAPGFASTGHGNYALESDSDCVDEGYNSASQQPSYSYEATVSRTSRSIVNSTIDIGAYEYGEASEAETTFGGAGSTGFGAGSTTLSE